MLQSIGKSIFIILFLLIQSVYAADKIPIFVSIVPQKYFVQQIGKELVDVQVMVKPGSSPATYEPKPRQMAALSKAKVYFAIGVPFENNWLKKIASTNPKIKVIHTDQNIDKRPITSHHDHDMKQKIPHDAERGLDPHIWLSPPLVKIQAQEILATLQKLDPIHQNVYKANYNQFISKIDTLDTQLNKIFSGKQGLKFMVFHPSWGYFAHTYQLRQLPIELEGKSPKPAQLKRLIELAKKNSIKIIFVQPQFSTKKAQLIAKEIDGQVVFANPLAEDWIVNLREVAKKFEAALK